MDLIITLVIGGVVGWLGSILMKTNAQMGLIANIIVGIVGALLGEYGRSPPPFFTQSFWDLRANLAGCLSEAPKR